MYRIWRQLLQSSCFFWGTDVYLIPRRLRFLASVFSPHRGLCISYEWHQPVLRRMSILSNLRSQWKKMFLPKICVQWFYVLISQPIWLYKNSPMVFPTFISSPCHHQAPPPPEGHLAIYRLPHPVCPRSRWISFDQWTKGTEVAAGIWRVTSPDFTRKKKHMLCIPTFWRCKVPFIVVHKDMSPVNLAKSPWFRHN